MSYRILTIDPGSTSTKIGVFDDEKMLFEENLHHSAEELAQFETIPQQEAFRRRLVLKALEEHHIPLESLSAVCGRGGVLKPVHGGTYLTTDAMIDTLKKGPYGHHASNLGGLLAREIGSALHIPSYIVDPPVVDELAPLARYSGHPLITRRSIFHALNQKAVAKRYAKEIGKPYESLNLIVCHMGGGVSVGAHVKGEVVDGKLYGRGTSDMKGAVASFTAAANFFAKDTARDFPGEIYIAGVVHEECFEGVAARSVSEIVKPDYVVIGEASLCNLKIGQRGRAEIVVETFGVPAHSANPEKGVNAVYTHYRKDIAWRALKK